SCVSPFRSRLPQDADPPGHLQIPEGDATGRRGGEPALYGTSRQGEGRRMALLLGDREDQLDEGERRPLGGELEGPDERLAVPRGAPVGELAHCQLDALRLQPGEALGTNQGVLSG